MARASAKKKTDNQAAEGKCVYLNEAVQDYDSSDFVRVSSFPRGMLLAFGKSRPNSDKFMIFKEIVLPFEVAKSLGDVITKQFERLISDGIITVDGVSELKGKTDGD